MLEPTARELARRGTPFVGALYAGLMLTPRGLRVLEFNCRLGDPEAQAILLKLRSDPLPLFLAAAQGRLASQKPVWDSRTCVAVVAAVEQQLAPRQHAAEIGGATKGAVDGRQRRRRRGVFEERSEQPEAHLAVGTTPQESAEALPLFAVMPELASPA